MTTMQHDVLRYQRMMVSPGQRLANGALVIETRFDTSQEQFGDYAPQGILLAMITYDDGEHEFATWSFVIRDKGVNTHAGRYHSNIFPAAKDFARRIGTGT